GVVAWAVPAAGPRNRSGRPARDGFSGIARAGRPVASTCSRNRGRRLYRVPFWLGFIHGIRYVGSAYSPGSRSATSLGSGVLTNNTKNLGRFDSMLARLPLWPVFIFLVMLAACTQEPVNSPYPREDAAKNVLHTAFTQRSPKYLDPASSYSTDETPFTY